MAANTDAFLQAFFGSGNELALPSEEGSADPLLRELLAEVRNQQSGMLPRVQSGVTVWYVLPRSRSDRLEQLENLRYATGLAPLRLSLGDEFDARVDSFTSGLGFRVRVPAPSRGSFREALKGQRLIRSLRPITSPLELSTTPDLLRQLDLAIVARQAETSDSFLTALDRGGHVSAMNLSFLKVRRLSGLGLWPELLALPEWHELLAIRRPALVTEAMLTAVYEQEIRPFEASPTKEVLGRFRKDVLPRHGGLFRTGAALRSPEALTMLVLYAASTEPPDLALRAQLLQKSSALQTGALFDAVFRLLDSEESGERPTAVEAFRQGRFDEAFALAKAESDSKQKTEVLLLSAVELQTIEAALIAASALAALSQSDRHAVLSSRVLSQSWASLRGLLGENVQPPNNWDEWLRQVNDGSLKDAVSLAEHGVLEWNLEDLAADLNRADQFATLIASPKSAGASVVFRSALPHLLLGLSMVRPDRLVVLQPVYEAVLLELLTSESIGRGDLDAIRDVVERLIDLGVAEDDFRNQVNDLTQLWRRRASLRWLDWVLELVEFLVNAPSAPRDLLRQMLLVVLTSIRGWTQAPDAVQHELLLSLARALELPEDMPMLPSPPLAVGTAVDLGPAIQYVGIYCVDESIAKRASELIRQLFPRLRVETSHDEVGSERLRALARSADLMVVAFRVATHAATDYIKAQRPQGKPTVFVQGRGSGSIVRSLVGTLTHPAV